MFSCLFVMVDSVLKCVRYLRGFQPINAYLGPGVGGKRECGVLTEFFLCRSLTVAVALVFPVPELLVLPHLLEGVSMDLVWGTACHSFLSAVKDPFT